MRVFSKIWLLIWKNLIFRRRHFCVTAWEIILPTLVAMFFAWLHAKIGASSAMLVQNEDSGTETKYDEMTESDIIKSAMDKFLKRSGPHPMKILFAPNDNRAVNVMKDVVANLGVSSEHSEHILGFPSEREAKAHVKDFLAAHTSTYDNEFPFGALVVLENLNWGQGSTPPEKWALSYKIRLIEQKAIDGAVVMEDHLYSLPLAPGPNTYNDDSYIESGFTGLQIALDKALIALFAGRKTEFAINTMAMPYPSGKERPGFNENGVDYFRNYLIVLGFIFIMPSVIRNVISEKESGIKELMKMMGLPNWMHWLGWMINSLMVLTLTSVIVTVLLFAPFTSATGAVFRDSSPTLFFVVLLLFAMSTTALCFLISTFFQKPAVGLTVGIVLYLVTYLAISIPMDFNYFYLSFPKKLFSTLMPTIGLHLYLKHISFQEGIGGGTWSNLFKGLDPTETFSIGIICMMLIFDTVLYTALALYFENIIPSEFGLRKPFYYPFLIFKRQQSSARVGPELEPEENHPGFEPEPTDLRAGVVIHNLRKEFGRHKVAVNMRGTLKMYHGQITALLGHNGAGKTTTLSILTGLFAPTSGTASVNGFDIRTDMESVRMNLGLCPQHNMIFQKLTVKEHLIFFGRLKGLSKQQALDELEALLWRMQMMDKIDTSAGKLSGGQKRRLCLAMALIGGTKVVILDEPTSGMDPEVRRAIWDLLLGMRGERTIVLTTHFMEEADVLGDRIAIMAEGEVKCCGTPSFLKKYYGAGYTLKLTVADPSVAGSVLEVVQKTFPNASHKKGSSGNAAEVDITIPTEANGNSKFPALFSALSSARERLGFQTTGLSLATMDDIFVKVGEDAGNEEHEINNPFQGIESIDSRHPSSIYLILMQFYAIFWKRMLYTLRNWKLFIAQFLLPLGMTIMAILLSNSILTPNGDEGPPLSLQLSAYSDKNPVTLFTASTNELATAYEEAVGSSAVRITSDPIDKALLKAGSRDLEAYRTRFIVAGDLKADSYTAIFSTLPNHASPLSVNLMSNAILRSMTPGKGYSIKSAVHPFRLVPTYASGSLANDLSAAKVAILFGSLSMLGLALLVASYAVAPIEEKLCQVKQLQLMTGVNPALYWAATFLWDIVAIFLLTCLIVISVAVFQNGGPLLANHGAGLLFLIVIFYGFAAVPLSYLFSTFGQSVAGIFSLITVIHVLTGNLVAVLQFVADLNVATSPVFRGIMRIFPSFSASLSIMHFVFSAVRNAECTHFTKVHQQRRCYTSSDEKERCCPNCVGTPYECYRYRPLLTWEFENFQLRSKYTFPGSGQDLFCLAVVGIVYLAILMVVEFGLVKKLLSKAGQVDPSIFAQMGSGDYDVQWEKGRVDYLVANGQVGEDALVVDNLCKSYGSFAAVSGLSFGVHYGECFGLLGVNGAGKTTSFRMLTGDEIRSFGNAYSTGTSLETDRGGFLSLIGYCPQFDGLIGVLTGREMVDLFGRLRGIRLRQVKTESMKWLFKLGLQDSANVQCQKYSGGMKRRLCAAISLVGDPPIVLLDEPTSGVDPIARRQFWKVIDSVKQTGQAVVLTSHSMEECEALCGRLGIMVNGQFQCMGGVQHLKTKFAMGYKLVVTLVAQGQSKEAEQAVKPKGAEQAVEPKGAEQELNAKASKASTKTKGVESRFEPIREPEHREEAGHPANATNPPEIQVKPKVSVSVPVADDADPIMSEEELKISALCDEITNGFNPCFLRERHQRVLEFQVTGVELGWGEMFGRMEKIRGAHAQMIEDYSITETTLEEVFLAFARVQHPERDVPVPFSKKLLTCSCCK